MLEHFIYMLPLVTLFCGIVFFAVKTFGVSATAQCCKLARFILALSFALNIIFYNRPMLYNFSSANHLTLIFICWLYMAAFISVYLARKWYSGIKQSGADYCGCVIWAVLGGIVLIVSKNIFITGVALSLLIFTTYRLLVAEDDNIALQYKKSFRNGAVGIISLLWLTLGGIYIASGSADYAHLQLFLADNRDNFLFFCALCCCILALVFYMGAAPLHYWLLHASSKISLPTLCFLLLLSPTLGIACLWRLNMLLFLPFAAQLNLFYAGLGVIAVFVGALTACGSSDIRQTLACSLSYCLGIEFLLMQHFTFSATQTGLVYWLICWLTLAGMMTGLFCFKSKGEYLIKFEQFANAARQNPYAAVMLILFVFSILGLPPLTGVLGLFAVLSELAAHSHFYIIVWVLIMLAILSYPYFDFMQKLYFENRRNDFDRCSADLYVALFIIGGVLTYIVIEPHYLIGQPWLMEILHG